MIEPVILREAAPSVRLVLDSEVAVGLVRERIATVTPVGQGEWDVSGVSRVGVVRIAGTEVRIEPKVPVARIFHLLSRMPEWSGWRPEEVDLDSIADLQPAIASLFTRMAEEALRQGALKSYREVRTAEAFIRGRWLVNEQIRVRQGLPLPAELLFDDFTVDTDENRLVRSAARRLLRLPGLAADLRTRLLRIDYQLADAQLLVPGSALPLVTANRRNFHYSASLGLARLILADASLQQDTAVVRGSGFLLTMSTVFERFVHGELARAAIPFGGRVLAQHVSHLDADRSIEVRPDLVWKVDGRVRAVFDAKYKAEKPSGYPNADIYQMLAYCIHHGVATGHLVYASGNATPARYEITRSGVTIVCHAIALDAAPETIAEQVDEIAREAMAERLVLS